MMKDYRLTIKIRNNRILKAIEAAGGTPGRIWCKQNGLSYTLVNHLINMTKSPLNSNGTLLITATKLCDVLGKLPDELWSNEQLYPLEKNFSDMEMDYAQVVELLPSSEQSYLPDFSKLEQKQTQKLIANALATLTDREREIIILRYGLRTDANYTYGEISKQFDVTLERIRQIEAKALRKLCHPAIAGMLVDAVDGISKTDRAKYKQATADYKADHETTEC